MAKYNYVLEEEPGINGMAGTKIQFLSGTQEALNQYFLNSGNTDKAGKANEGSFYLTTDTHRLYIGREVNDNGTTKVVPVAINEGIQVVDRLEYNESFPNDTYLPSNPQIGEFYYVKDGNILAIYHGLDEENRPHWVQLNPDTNTWIDTKVASLTISDAYVKDIYTQVESNATFDAQETYYTKTGDIYTEATGLEAFAEGTTYYTKTSDDKLTVDVTLAQTSLNSNNTSATSPADIVTSFTIPLDGNGGIFNLIDAGITSSVTPSGVASVSLTGPAANNSAIEISGGNGTTITGTANGFQISGKTYDLISPAVSGATAVNAAQIQLKDEHNNTDTVTVKTGANLLINNTAADEFTVYHTGPTAAVSEYVLTPDKKFQTGKAYYTYSNDTYTPITLGTNEDDNATYKLGGDIPVNTIYEYVTSFGDNATNPSEGGVIRVPKISRDENGHIVNISDVGVTLPTAGGIAGITADHGKLKLTKNDGSTISSPDVVTYYYDPATGEAQSGVTYYTRTEEQNTYIYTEATPQPTVGTNISDSGYYVAVAGPALGHVITVDGTTNVVSNQSYLGDFYSATKVDEQIRLATQGLNALTYRGVVGSQTRPALPTAADDVKIGDVYVVDNNVAKLTYTDKDENTSIEHLVNPGDLLIAQGTEGADGYITSETLKWARIQSGDIDTTYTWTPGDIVSIDDNHGVNLGKFTVADGAKIDVVHSLNAGVDTWTVSHVESGLISDNTQYKILGPTESATLNPGSTFTVPVIKADAWGHIVEGATQTFTLPQSKNDEYSFANKLNANPPDTTLRLLKNGTAAVGQVTLAGDNNEGVLVRVTPVYALTTDSVAQAGTTYYTDNTGATVVPVTVGETSVVGYYVATTPEGSIDIKHATKTVSRPATLLGTITVNDANANKFTVISGVSTDSFGHVSQIDTTEYTLPVYTTGWSPVTTSSGVKSFTGTLYENGVGRGTVIFESSTLNISTSDTDTNDNRTYTVDLVWGTF